MTVNDSFRDEHGSQYLGSRDIDVCFHIDSTVSGFELRNSTFTKAIAIVQELSYLPHGSCRYCKMIWRDTREIITEAVARDIPIHELFYLYVDMMVDNIRPMQKEIFGFNVLDEPILGRVFEEQTGVMVNLDGLKILIPPPFMLLATKLISIPMRTKDDKQVKDACDIYSILWHSPENYRKILTDIHSQYPEDCKKGFNAITDEISKRAAFHLGVDVERYRDVIKPLGEMRSSKKPSGIMR
ncbi:MAG: hypothetical protein Q7V05_01880 [Methanoregula sp.]|nr:hypothetical protein [Methanoregula sp.]